MPSIGTKFMKILCYSLWTTTDRIVTRGFFLNNRPKGAKNTPGLSFPRYILPLLGLY